MIDPQLGFWLEKCRQVSLAHFAMRGGHLWSIGNQLLHVHSEVTEFYELLRAWNKSELQKLSEEQKRRMALNEICDIIYSAITCTHIMKFSDDEILDGLLRTLKRIQKRVGVA